VVCRRYVPWREVESFGQADTTLKILLRKDSVTGK
jgi:hypothetical protein